jgi:hypothetical protein
MPTSKGGALELWRGVEEVEGEGTSTMAITDTYSTCNLHDTLAAVIRHVQRVEAGYTTNRAHGTK